MSVQTNIPEQIHPEVLARIAEQARRAGSSVNNFLSRLLDEAEAEAAEAGVEMTPEERARAFEEWANNRRSAAPPLSDDAISRESIYTREDGQL
jgi:TRAP-type C4-dicarboxylate transport system substrate-binding protein